MIPLSAMSRCMRFPSRVPPCAGVEDFIVERKKRMNLVLNHMAFALVFVGGVCPWYKAYAS